GDGVTSLDVLTNRTGDGHVGFGLSLVDHVITGNGVDRDGSFRQVGIDTVAAVSFSAGRVTGRVFRFHLGVNITVLSQLSTRNVHVPSLAVGINGGRVVLAVHGHSDGVASLDIFTHGTGDGHVGFGLSLVDHIITGNGVNRDGGFRQRGLHTVVAVSFSASGIAGSVFRFHLGVYVRISSQLSTRNIHV